MSSTLIKNPVVLETIKKYLTIREKEKKDFGEVFTPLELIYDMLSKLPPKVWKNPNLKWLDPSTGIGNFSIVVYYKLMVSLENVSGYKNKETRSKHIIEKMIYMVELNPVNVKICKKIFKLIDPNAKPNIRKISFFKYKLPSDIVQFDIIMGNPPFQKKVGPSKSEPIWHLFVINSIKNYLKKNGYLVFVHPSGWRNIRGRFREVFELVQKLNLKYLTMRTFEDGVNIFGGAGTNFDYYCLKNTPNKNNKTIINDIDRENHKINLNNYIFIPSGEYKLYNKLLALNNEEKVHILHSNMDYETRLTRATFPISHTKKGKYIYPILNTITKRDGPKISAYTTEKNSMFVPKVIWSNGSGTYPILDKKGEFGLTQFAYGITDNITNLKKIKKVMESPKFIKLMKYCKFEQKHKYNFKIISEFKKDFYKYF